jgi:penicillin-binding protein 1B
VVDLLQEVLRSGTGAVSAAAASRCLRLERPGRRATAGSPGFPSELLCVVWVGFDDNHDLNLEGAKSALPIGPIS